jgi:hypothetical protein
MMDNLPPSFSQQIQIDQLFWQQVLNLVNYNKTHEQQKAIFFQRLFVVLYHVGLLVKEAPTSNYSYAKISCLPLVCYLSHGYDFNLVMDKKTFHGLISFLCQGELLTNNQPYQESRYIANNKDIAKLKQQLLYKSSTHSNSAKLERKNSNSMSYDEYILDWAMAEDKLQLRMAISKSLMGKVHLTLSLHGYPYSWDIQKPENHPHPLLQHHKEQEKQYGREFLIPHPKLGIKGELTQTELEYISQMPFSFAILVQPPTQHQEAELDSNILPPLDIFLQNLIALEARACFSQLIIAKYQAYKNIDINHYRQRRDAINKWLGSISDNDSTGLLDIQRKLLENQFLPYTTEQQKIIHTELIDPLITLLVKELMAIIKLL